MHLGCCLRSKSRRIQSQKATPTSHPQNACRRRCSRQKHHGHFDANGRDQLFAKVCPWASEANDVTEGTFERIPTRSPQSDPENPSPPPSDHKIHSSLRSNTRFVAPCRWRTAGHSGESSRCFQASLSSQRMSTFSQSPHHDNVISCPKPEDHNWVTEFRSQKRLVLELHAQASTPSCQVQGRRVETRQDDLTCHQRLVHGNVHKRVFNHTVPFVAVKQQCTSLNPVCLFLELGLPLSRFRDIGSLGAMTCPCILLGRAQKATARTRHSPRPYVLTTSLESKWSTSMSTTGVRGNPVPCRPRPAASFHKVHAQI